MWSVGRVGSGGGVERTRIPRSARTDVRETETKFLARSDGEICDRRPSFARGRHTRKKHAPISAPRPLRPHTSTEAPARRRMDSRPYTASWRECRSSSISPAAVIAFSVFVRGFFAREMSSSES